MIRGLSFQRGVFFIGKKHVGYAYDKKNGERVEAVRRLNVKAWLTMFALIVRSLPVVHVLFICTFVALIYVPKSFPQLFSWDGLPEYSIFYLAFGLHFLFPKELRQYHGAEHKVFSDRGIKSLARLYMIRRAAITNERCSTNVVVLFFLIAIGLFVLLSLFQVENSFMWATYIAVPSSFLMHKLLFFNMFAFLRRPLLKLSYFLQVHVTTKAPTRRHLATAICAYRRLAEVEFPHHLAEEEQKSE